jgi:NO-binding membrane sensor protein with MHYT domain
MTEATANNSESSLLLWLVAMGVMLLAAHVFLAWIRHAQREPALRQSWPALLAAAASMGTGICSAMVLALSAEALAFPLGYQWWRVLLLWGGAMLGCMPVAWWLWRRPGLVATLGGGALLAALAVGVQMGWVMAVGFRPGIVWRTEFVALAAVLTSVGAIVALGVAFSSSAAEGQRRGLWRLGGAALLGVSLLVGQEGLFFSISLAAQVGSVFHREVPAFILCLLGGVLVPLVMSAMAFDLAMRRRSRRRAHKGAGSGFSPQPRRRRRRYKHRQL